MEASFWHEKWARGDIGFHIAEANAMLVKHIAALQLPAASRIFLPLCGKTLDMHWLLQKGYRIVGIDLSELAIRALFAELGWQPQVTQVGALLQFSAPNIDLFAGDFFQLSAATLGQVDAVYDRAALVALPETMRSDYTAHLMQMTRHAPQLLIAYDYNQMEVDGPPFAVNEEEVRRHYAGNYALRLLERQQVVGGMKGKTAATEAVWHLSPN
ncbi:thiopurine S-methyltransferase [soil metagenome]